MIRENIRYTRKKDFEFLFPVKIGELINLGFSFSEKFSPSKDDEIIYLDAEGYKQFMARQSLHKEEISNVVKTDFGGKLK